MANISLLFNNFSSGEVSPLLAGRGDTEFMNRGARKLRNFIPMISGGVRKRPGTRFVGFTTVPSKPARVIPYYDNKGGYILLEYSENKLAFRDANWNPLEFRNDNAEFDHELANDVLLANDVISQVVTLKNSYANLLTLVNTRIDSEGQDLSGVITLLGDIKTALLDLKTSLETVSVKAGEIFEDYKDDHKKSADHAGRIKAIKDLVNVTPAGKPAPPVTQKVSDITLLYTQLGVTEYENINETKTLWTELSSRMPDLSPVAEKLDIDWEVTGSSSMETSMKRLQKTVSLTSAKNTAETIYADAATLYEKVAAIISSPPRSTENLPLLTTAKTNITNAKTIADDAFSGNASDPDNQSPLGRIYNGLKTAEAAANGSDQETILKSLDIQTPVSALNGIPNLNTLAMDNLTSLNPSAPAITEKLGGIVEVVTYILLRLSWLNSSVSGVLSAIDGESFREKAVDVPDPMKISYVQSNENMLVVGEGIGAHRMTFDRENKELGLTQIKISDKDQNREYKTGTFYAGRLWLAGSPRRPNRIWASRAPDSVTGTFRYDDFSTQTVINDETDEKIPLAGDGIILDENDMFGGRITWIAQAQRLIVGTDRATWADTGEIPTPATFDLNIVEYAGAADIQAKGTGEAVLYAGRDRKTLRALVYQATTAGQGYIDVDLSQNAAHLFRAGIRDFDVASYPYPMAWIVLEDGTVVSVTLDIRGGMTAFSRHDLGGTAESVAVAHGKDGDVVWFVVNRLGLRTVETLVMNDLVNAVYEDSCYCDGAVSQSTAEKTTVLSGLLHLSGMEIAGLADGSVTERVTVAADGTATFLNPFNNITAGLPVESELIPTCPELPLNGTSLGKKRRVEAVTARVYDSFGGKAGTAEDKLEDLPYLRYGAYKLGESPAPYTGDLEVFVAGRIDPEGKIVIKHGEPAPFTLLALVERVAAVEA